MQFKHESIKQAGQHAVEDLREDGGLGGAIVLDSEGNGKQNEPGLIGSVSWIRSVAMPMNSPGMYRGVIREDGVPMTAIFSDEEVAKDHVVLARR